MLTEDEASFLDENGYVVLEDALTSDELSELRNRIAELIETERGGVGNSTITQTRINLARSDDYLARTKLKIHDILFSSSCFIGKLLFKLVPDLRFAVNSYVARGGLAERFGEPFSLRREFFGALVSVADKEQKGVVRLVDLVNKGIEFDRIYTNPRVLAGVRQIIGEEFRLSSLNFRSPEPGYGLQRLHADWDMPVSNQIYYACNALWILEDTNLKNGATRVVPGSHKFGKLPESEMSNTHDPHPQERLISAKAGSVLLLNSHTWHGGTLNRSGRNRPILQCYFSHRACQQQLMQRVHIKTTTRNRLSPEALWILDA